MGLIFGNMDATATIISMTAVGLAVGGLVWWYKTSPWLAFVAWCASWLLMHIAVPAAIKVQLSIESSYNTAEMVSNGLPFWFTPLKWLLIGPIVGALICGFVRPEPMQDWFGKEGREE